MSWKTICESADVGLLQQTAMVAQSRRRSRGNKVQRWLEDVQEESCTPCSGFEDQYIEDQPSLAGQTTRPSNATSHMPPSLDESLSSTPQTTPVITPEASPNPQSRAWSVPSFQGSGPTLTSRAAGHPTVHFRNRSLEALEPSLFTERGEEQASLPKADTEARLRLELARMKHKSERMLAAALRARGR